MLSFKKVDPEISSIGGPRREMKTRPTFNVRALKTGAGYVIEALWPGGRTERLVGIYISRELAETWVRKHGDSWIELNQPKSQIRLATS